MRPRKKILLHCVDEDRRSVLAFVLDNRGYRVVAGFAQRDDIDLALVIDDAAESEAFSRLAAEYVPDMHMLVLAKPGRRHICVYPCRAMMPAVDISMEEMLERIRVLLARKRGPKKRGPYGPRVATQEAVTA